MYNKNNFCFQALRDNIYSPAWNNQITQTKVHEFLNLWTSGEKKDSDPRKMETKENQSYNCLSM